MKNNNEFSHRQKLLILISITVGGWVLGFVLVKFLLEIL
jgi:hypothetical protein